MSRSICKIDGCQRFVTGRGLCNAHYRMMRKHGDPLVKNGITPGTVRAWLLQHVNWSSDECLTFPFARSAKGYGAIRIDGMNLAHQWMCQEVNGKSPIGSPFALHLCGNGNLGCVNPNHLYWGSGAENYQDQIRHGVSARGSRNGKAVLDEESVRSIRARRLSGETYKEIAKTYNVHRDTVRSVVKGKAWSWVCS